MISDEAYVQLVLHAVKYSAEYAHEVEKLLQRVFNFNMPEQPLADILRLRSKPDGTILAKLIWNWLRKEVVPRY